MILNILSIASFIKYNQTKPYYNQRIQKLFCVLTAVFSWGNIVLLIVKILEKSKFNGGLQLYFLGIPLIVALVLFDKDNRMDVLLRNISSF